MTAIRQTDDLPKVVPPLAPVSTNWRRTASPGTAVSWLTAGWQDFVRQPGPSLIYGLLVFCVSLAVVASIFYLEYDYILFPALSGFLVIAPLVAAGLYEKSKALASGRIVTLKEMIFVKAASGGQIVFVGLLLCLLMVLWNRAAVLLYALFYGFRPFGGLEAIIPELLGTPEGWMLLMVGSLIGGLFAAFAFAISVFAVPRLFDERVDAFTAMGHSMAIVWNNLPVMLSWAAIVVALFVLSVATALVGLIVVFPILGHATWHAFVTMRGPAQKLSLAGTQGLA